MRQLIYFIKDLFKDLFGTAKGLLKKPSYLYETALRIVYAEVITLAVYYSIAFFKQTPVVIPKLWNQIILYTITFTFLSWVYYRYKLGLWRHEYREDIKKQAEEKIQEQKPIP